MYLFIFSIIGLILVNKLSDNAHHNCPEPKEVEKSADSCILEAGRLEQVNVFAFLFDKSL